MKKNKQGRDLGEAAVLNKAIMGGLVEGRQWRRGEETWESEQPSGRRAFQVSLAESVTLGRLRLLPESVSSS